MLAVFLGSSLWQAENFWFKKCVVCVSRINWIVIRMDSIVIKIDSRCRSFDLLSAKLTRFYHYRFNLYYNRVYSEHNRVDFEHNQVDSGDAHNTFFESTILTRVPCHASPPAFATYCRWIKLGEPGNDSGKVNLTLASRYTVSVCHSHGLDNWNHV